MAHDGHVIPTQHTTNASLTLEWTEATPIKPFNVLHWVSYYPKFKLISDVLTPAVNRNSTILKVIGQNQIFKKY